MNYIRDACTCSPSSKKSTNAIIYSNLEVKSIVFLEITAQRNSVYPISHKSYNMFFLNTSWPLKLARCLRIRIVYSWTIGWVSLFVKRFTKFVTTFLKSVTSSQRIFIRIPMSMSISNKCYFSIVSSSMICWFDIL